MGKYQEIRWLSIEEIASLWSVEMQVASSLVARELQLSVINIPNLNAGGQLIESVPAEGLAPLTTLLDKAHLEQFCAKQPSWPKPVFWFGRDERGPSYPGRPSVSHAIVQELERIASVGELRETVADQSRVLAEWAASRNWGITQPPTARTIENFIRRRYRELNRPI